MQKKNAVGEKIRQFRLGVGITQEELALRSGLSQGYINQLELGKRNYTQKSLELIASALSKSLGAFFQEGLAAEAVGISDATSPFKTRRAYKKEFLSVLKDLPEQIIAHYLTLLSIERDLYKSGKKNR